MAARRLALKAPRRRHYSDAEHWPHGLVVFIWWQGSTRRGAVNDFVSQSAGSVGVTVDGVHVISTKRTLVQVLEPMLR